MLTQAIRNIGGVFDLSSHWTAWKNRRALDRIAMWEVRLEERSDEELREATRSLRYRVRRADAFETFLPEAFGLIRVASHRTLGMRPYDVQLLGGAAIARGCIAEMQTGEGKTLTAIAPLFLFALMGKGAHLATVNDYLAARDAEFAMPVFESLGMSVGSITSESSPPQRASAYAADVTYGVANEMGFDFLRDRLKTRELLLAGELVDSPQAMGILQRAPYFALVDEADSILIDEASTPLVIGVADENPKHSTQACFRWAAASAGAFDEATDFEFNATKKTITLTRIGREKTRRLAAKPGLGGVGLVLLYEAIERAIKVAREFHRDIHYTVRDGEIAIVDEFTGRIAEGRKWQAGIHQAIEAKERLAITDETRHAAQITVQDLFRRYPHLGGMTGTASSAVRELGRVYQRSVAVIPTNRPSQRTALPVQVFATSDARFDAVVAEVQTHHAQCRPVLVGTRSIEQSIRVSAKLTEAGIPHSTLNANQSSDEAEIIAQAGLPGRTTVATNMAGRGTDIKLGQGVADIGGLHVICTEMHESARIDRQLIGRCARQGDPGSYRLMISLEDELLIEGLGAEQAHKLREHPSGKIGIEMFQSAQRNVEGEKLAQRMILLHQAAERNKMQRSLGFDPFLDSPE